MRGRKPDLTNVTPLPGMTGAPRANPVPRPPRGLAEDVRKIWKAEAPRLAELGRLDAHYIVGFEAYCRAIATMHRMSDKIDQLEAAGEDGYSYTTYGRNGTQEKKRQEWQIYHEAFSEYLRLAQEYGTTPLADVRLKDPTQPDLFDLESYLDRGSEAASA